MSYKSILLDVTEGVATVTLNRPQTLNAIDLEMVGELNDVVNSLADGNRARALLLTGSGRGFSSGADLLGGDIAPGKVDTGLILETQFNPLLETLFTLQIPVVTAVNGPAAGAGCSLALAGDIVLAGKSAYFLQAFVNIGLVPDVGSTWMLPRHIGRARATAMMMLAERIKAEQAESWGLIWKAVPDETLMDEARAIARKLAAGPTRAYAMTRVAIRNALEQPLTSTLQEERRNQYLVGQTSDHAEGVAAFIGKRKADFKGE